MPLSLLPAAVAVAILAGTPAPQPGPPITGGVSDQGADVGGRAGGGHAERGPAGGTVPGRSTGTGVGTRGGPGQPAGPQLERVNVIACGGNSVNEPGQETCQLATMLCAGKPGIGVMTDVYQRFAGGTDPWTFVARTCNPDALAAPSAGGAAPRQLTLADIQEEFARTRFATGLPSLQPVDARTLVTLPVYFQLAWSPDGYRPGQTRTVSLLGRTVDLAIRLDHCVYAYGDGTDSGPSTSLGGGYPDGAIRHAYPSAGTYSPEVTVVFAADYRVDGGAWAPLPGTATRSVPYPALTVLTATNRLRT